MIDSLDLRTHRPEELLTAVPRDSLIDDSVELLESLEAGKGDVGHAGRLAGMTYALNVICLHGPNVRAVDAFFKKYWRRIEAQLTRMNVLDDKMVELCRLRATANK